MTPDTAEITIAALESANQQIAARSRQLDEARSRIAELEQRIYAIRADLVSAQSSGIAKDARIAALEAGLKPFAKFCEIYEKDIVLTPGLEVDITTHFRSGIKDSIAKITLTMVREARALLSQP